MTKRSFSDNFRLIFVITGLLLFCTGLSSAFGSLLPENRAYRPEVRVDSCHLVVEQKQVTCCQSESCHQSVPQKRDFDSPEYHIQYKILHSLVHESRPLIPKMKSGKPFIINHPSLPRLFSQTRDSLAPLQSLHSLRTIVLLN